MNAAAWVVHQLWKGSAAASARRFARALADPEPVQRAILSRILCNNARTEFGRAHGFSSLTDVEAYQSAVPVRDYSEFTPWIDSAANGAPDVLFPGRPSVFLPTSGTSTGAKLIPWNQALKREFGAALGPWVHGFMRSQPTAWGGSTYWSLSPPVWSGSWTAGGIPIGFESDASYLPAVLRPFLGAAFAVPSSVTSASSPDAWRYATLLHLLGAGDLSMISIWSPTFLTALLDPLSGWWESLLHDMSNGTFSPPGENTSRPLRCRKFSRRAEILSKLARSGVMPGTEKIWPNLAVISCWTDAASRVPSQRLARLFPHAKIIGKGLVATEGVVSIPWPEASAPVLVVTSHFLEFSDDAGRIHPAWDLRRDECYSVILTTSGGLYRYRLNDRIRVVGFHENCPMIEFVGRVGVSCDLCGEKLAEPFVRDCLERVSRSLGLVWEFMLMAPSSSIGKPAYILFFSCETPVDTGEVARVADAALCENPHYAHARRIGQLDAVTAVHVPGNADRIWAKFQSAMAMRGQRLGDIKPSALDSSSGWELVFEISERSSAVGST